MEEWKECRLGDYCDFQNGYAFKSSEFKTNGEYKIVKIKELKDGLVKFFDDSASVDIHDIKEFEKYKIYRNDVLFALTGDPVSKPNPLSWVGRVSIYRSDENALLNQRTCKIKKSDEIDNQFLYYYFRQWENFYALASKATGSASQANISTNTIADTIIKLPPLPTQQKIAAILSSLDDKIELNNKINTNLEQQAQALFKNWFVDDSEKFHTIGDYIVPKRGKNLLSKDAIHGEVPVVAGGLEPATYHNTANTKAPVLTISASGANAGFVNLWNIPVWSSDSSYIDSGMTNDVYFWYILLKLRQKEIFDSQTGSAQPHIYPQHISVMPISELDFDKVSKFTKQVTPFFEQIGANQQENLRLIALRDTLLPKLMNGDI